jgi:hypothetical protein
MIDLSDLKEIKEIIVALAAFVGMGLGVYNFLNERRKTKVHLRVTPLSVLEKYENSIKTSENTFNPNVKTRLFGIEIVNLSSFDVTIDSIGFLPSKGNDIITIITPIILSSNKEFPRKLEPRESVTIYSNLDALIHFDSAYLIKTAFAKTACGHRATGKSKALDELVKFCKK